VKVELRRIRLSAPGTINVPRGVARVISRELYIDAGEFGGLTGPLQRVVLPEMNEMFLQHCDFAVSLVL